MALVKVGTSKMPVTDKIQFARQIVTQMTGNTNFTTPAPTLASITAAANGLETAYNNAQAAQAQAKSLTSTQDDASAALDLLLTQEGNYVENASGGDQAKIESSGFSVRNIPAGPIGDLPAPADVDVTPNDNAGTVNMSWEKVRGAYTYIVEKAADAPSLTWAPALTATKTKVVVNTMTSGAKYWFRVSAVGAAGQGPWSDPISKYAP
jgi:hypothetical protein